MKAIYLRQGLTLNYPNTSGTTISAGDIVPLGSRVGVAGCDIAAGEVGAVHLVGVFRTPKKASEAIALGETVYYSADGITATAADNVPAGYAVAAADAADEFVCVKLLG